MAKSLKVNFVFNFANTIFGLLFPLITFPYISRVLLADGIGLVQFFQSIINYIALFCALGIPLYAVKEIARVKNNIDKKKSNISRDIDFVFIPNFYWVFSRYNRIVFRT